MIHVRNNLADTRQVAVVLRLTLDENEQFTYGELVDLEGRRIGRFVDWLELKTLVQAWITALAKSGPMDSFG
jgi:hypothetical protein